jgi:hypothetical protein
LVELPTASINSQGAFGFQFKPIKSPSGPAPSPRCFAKQVIGTGSPRRDCPEIVQEAIMSHWHDTMVDRPETNGAVYVTGWTISGLAVLGAILAVWVFGI